MSTELTDKQIGRQDFVDNAIYNLVKELNPTSKSIDWNTEHMSNIRDAIWDCYENLNICKEQEFYPYIKIREIL